MGSGAKGLLVLLVMAGALTYAYLTVESQSEVGAYSVLVGDCDDSMKVSAVKVIHEVTRVGLAEAERMFEGLPEAVLFIDGGLDREAADALIAKLAEAGLEAETMEAAPPTGGHVFE